MFLGTTPAPSFARNAPADIIDTASPSLVPLPNQAIARIKGSGFEGPELSHGFSPGGTITLWDELKPAAPAQNTLNGTMTIIINGITK